MVAQLQISGMSIFLPVVASKAEVPQARVPIIEHGLAKQSRPIAFLEIFISR